MQAWPTHCGFVCAKGVWAGTDAETSAHTRAHKIQVKIYLHMPCACIPAYLHTCMHAFIPTYIHTYMHACMHTYIRTYIHIYIHTYIHTDTHTYRTELYRHMFIYNVRTQRYTCCICECTVSMQKTNLIIPFGISSKEWDNPGCRKKRFFFGGFSTWLTRTPPFFCRNFLGHHFLENIL